MIVFNYLVALILATSPVNHMPVVYVDKLELNHVYGHDGNPDPVLNQWIGWEWFEDVGYVAHWWLAVEKFSVSRVSNNHNDFRFIFADIHGVHPPVVLVAKYYKESWTMDDPETRNRRLVPNSTLAGGLRESWPSSRPVIVDLFFER